MLIRWMIQATFLLTALLASAILLAQAVGAARNADMLAYVYQPATRDTRTQIGLLDLQTGDAFRISTLPDAYHAHPRWSPDGSMLTFMGTPEGATHVYTLHLPGRELKQWSATAGDRVADDYALFRDPRWTADGCCLVFHENRGLNENRRFFVVEMATETVTEVDVNDPRIQTYLNSLFPVRHISPDGTQVADLGFGDGQFRLFLGPMTDDNVSYAQALEELVTAPLRTTIPTESVRWSLDGTRLVYVVDNPVITDLYLIDAVAGAEPILLIEGAQPDWRP